jgi:methenyltetrahydrofolate cyclohydrolase
VVALANGGPGVGNVSDIVPFLDDLASSQPAPGGGAAAAMTAAMGAALVAMAARSSGRWDDAPAVAAAADEARERATALIGEDGRAYAEVLAAEPNRDADPERFLRAVEGANRAPTEVCEVADRVSALGERAVAEGSRRLRGDAIAGLVLAEAAAATALELIALNTTYGDLPEGVLRDAEAHRGACRERLARVRGRP